MNIPGDGHPMRRKIGTSAAMITPFNPDGTIDWPRLAAHARHLLGTGMSVVTVFGTTGEGVSIAAADVAEVYVQMAAHGQNSAHFVECVYGPSARNAGLHMRRSLEAGCAGILLTPPFYFKGISEEGLFNWHAEVFEAAGGAARDVILYNIPQLTCVTIGPALTGRLRRAFPEVIAGVKDSGGQWSHTVTLLAEHRDLAILVGHEGDLAKAVRHGASGAISGIANVAPRLVAKLVSGEDDPAIDGVLAKVLSLPVVPAIKAIMAAQTGDPAWRRVASPLVALSAPGELDLCSDLARQLA